MFSYWGNPFPLSPSLSKSLPQILRGFLSALSWQSVVRSRSNFPLGRNSSNNSTQAPSCLARASLSPSPPPPLRFGVEAPRWLDGQPAVGRSVGVGLGVPRCASVVHESSEIQLVSILSPNLPLLACIPFLYHTTLTESFYQKTATNTLWLFSGTF